MNDSTAQHPRIRAALDTIASPEARHLPTGWDAALQTARQHLRAASDTLQGLPGTPEDLWAAGMPAAGLLRDVIRDEDEGVAECIRRALELLGVEHAADLAVARAESLASGEATGPNGVAELLDYADAVRRFTNAPEPEEEEEPC